MALNATANSNPGLVTSEIVEFSNSSIFKYLKKKDEARLRTKVHTMLQIAERHGHDVVVLGASGCGAWKCPPEHIAEIFRDVVQEYRRAFRVVVFAVLKQADDQAAAKAAMGIEDNYDIFKRLFSE